MRSIVFLLALVPVVAHADSFTVEAGVGVGEQLGVTAPSAAFGIGGWILPQLALTARVAALTLAPQPGEGPVIQVQNLRRTFVFAGPSLQYWLDRHVWLAAGVGLEEMVMSSGLDGHGVGLDLRAGYAIGAFDVSLEVTPSYSPSGGGLGADLMPVSATTTGVALLAGYQFR